MTMSGGDDEMVPRKDWTGTCRRWRRDVERRDGENEISDCRLRTGRMLGLYATCEASGRSAISAPARDAHPMLFNMTYGVRDGYRGSCAGLAAVCHSVRCAVYLRARGLNLACGHLCMLCCLTC